MDKMTNIEINKTNALNTYLQTILNETDIYVHTRCFDGQNYNQASY